MNLFRLFILLSFVFGCSTPKKQTPPPNIDWTASDEPPMYPDCPLDNPQANWQCFTNIIQKKLNNKLQPFAKHFPKGTDTLFFSLKVDTLGQLHLLGVNKDINQELSSLVLPQVTSTLSDLPALQPAFKTNLEIPVEVRWTLPVCVTK